MEKPTLYISDLDGTLLNSQASLSEFARSTLEQMLARGLLFTVASARNVISIRTALDHLPLRLPVIDENGAFVSDLSTGRHETAQGIDPGDLDTITSLSSRLGMIPFVSTFDNTQDHLYCPAATNPGMQWYIDALVGHKDPRVRQMDNLSDHLNNGVVCLSYIDTREQLEIFKEELGILKGSICANLFDVDYFPGWPWLTVLDARANKAEAINTLRRTHFLQNCRLVVFGDQMNDLSMFAIADHAVAVKNATEEVKAAADEVVGSYVEDAVVRYILEREYGW